MKASHALGECGLGSGRWEKREDGQASSGPCVAMFTRRRERVRCAEAAVQGEGESTCSDFSRLRKVLGRVRTGDTRDGRVLVRTGGRTVTAVERAG